MCIPTTTADRNWKRIFLAVETFVGLGGYYGIIMRVTHRYDEPCHPHMVTAFRFFEPMLTPMFWSFLGAAFFLILASPFFLRSLRGTALCAWLVGATGLLLAGLFFTR
jgi:hypothetical protein